MLMTKYLTLIINGKMLAKVKLGEHNQIFTLIANALHETNATDYRLELLDRNGVSILAVDGLRK